MENARIVHERNLTPYWEIIFFLVLEEKLKTS